MSTNRTKRGLREGVKFIASALLFLAVLIIITVGSIVGFDFFF